MDTIVAAATAKTLRYGFGRTKLGLALVAMSETGVAAILFGDDAGKIRRDLRQIFPGAELVPDEAGLAPVIAEIADFVEAPRRGLDLPLDLCGSPLELAVWEALRAIPPGETRSYGEVARSLPIPATAQEVGAACAANILAVAIPCHRLVKADGSISGYRWGVWRKRRLIYLEGALA
ncbi:MAG TPA: methylated-DNA--[protein]-cysteine S-methyltransferase [Candidatus Sulfotelmatobacter sp.]|nr:methylated-DNA--[protein]-cysteine S-methyltransferase [Candidatus Sulfotelmatobacter sp.]